MPNRSEISRLFDANVADLVIFRRRVNSNPVVRLYADVLYSYLQCDLAGLERTKNEIDETLGSSRDEENCKMVTELRLRIRKHEVDRRLLDKALEYVVPSNAWSGEIYFTVAMSFTKIQDDRNAQKTYELAFSELEKIGAKRKATKALFNHLVAESRIYPDKKLIADYHYLAKRAAKFKEYGTAAICCNNISREYQKLGALEIALNYSNRSIRFLKDDVGMVDYYLAIAHRCHLLVELGRTQEAELDYQTAQAGDFIEIREALKVIDIFRNKSDGTIVNISSLTPTWRQRHRENKDRAPIQQKKLSALEGKLLEFIAQAPRTKFEIIAHLYREKADFKLLEDRLKNLMNRLKKSRPELIIFENQKYRISDESFLETHWFKKRSS